MASETAATHATLSPTYRTLSSARACSSCPTGRMPKGLGASLPVTTATTPSSFSARVVSMFLMRACGCGECRILPYSMPATERSSVYLPAPVVLPAASIIAIALPIMEKSVVAGWSFGISVLSSPFSVLSCNPCAQKLDCHPGRSEEPAVLYGRSAPLLRQGSTQ